MRNFLLVVLTIFPVLQASAQQRTLSGKVTSFSGEAVRGANVFLLETLDGAISDSTGRFTLSARIPTGALLVVQRIGYREARIAVGAADAITIMLQSEAVALPALNVVAGRFSTGDGPDVQLNSIEVVSTPGAAADVYRALQTFPGLQPVDEGAGLFVRGGDIAETRVFLNESIVLSPYRYESPTGGFFGAFDPFLLSGIQFSTGGFGARYGNALSGVAALRTVGRPDRASAGATVSLAALSGTAALPLGNALGLRGTLTRSHTGLMFRVNGNGDDFTHSPEGRDASVIGSWVHRSGEVRFFAIDQWSTLGVTLDGPSFTGALKSEDVHRAQVLSWDERIGLARATVVAGNSEARNAVSFGNFDITLHDQQKQLRAFVERPVSALIGLTVGGELLDRIARYTGRTPKSDFARDPDAPTSAIHSRLDDRLVAGFVETDWTPTLTTRAIVGLRADHSQQTAQTTLDPRASFAWRAAPLMTFTAAWGIYHQVPDPDMDDPDFGGGDLHSMRAEHRILGLQLGADNVLLRAEAFQKRYRDLAQFTRERFVVDGGVGQAHGVDVFMRWPEWHGLKGRVSYSYIHARRTDPDTNLPAVSPFDITHVWTSVIEYAIAPGFQLSIADRHATGKPFTPVVSASFNNALHVWEPEYGKPNSERLPAFHRIDVSANRLIPLNANRLLVLFVSMDNIFNRKNIYDYTYNEDYTKRIASRSQFLRSVYFGASVNF